MPNHHMTPNGPIPFTDEEEAQLLIEIDNYKKEFNAISYKSNRIGEYPPITDYLDGIVKGDQAQIQKYINDCLEVKSKYPKPE